MDLRILKIGRPIFLIQEKSFRAYSSACTAGTQCLSTSLVYPFNVQRYSTSLYKSKGNIDHRRACFAVVGLGLERVLLAELQALGFIDLVCETGGISFKANDERLFQANYWLRTPTRILVRIKSFTCTTFYDLERELDDIPWQKYIGGDRQKEEFKIQFRVTSVRSKLYHESAVIERFQKAVSKRIRSVIFPNGDFDDLDNGSVNNSQLFVIRIANDVVSISADSSGISLYRRGYKLAISKAPLRESIAAGALLAIGYNGLRPLIDPMCGSGTFVTEAVMIARNIPPGFKRSFRCEFWEAAPKDKIQEMRYAANAKILPSLPSKIIGYDRDAGAITSSSANYHRIMQALAANGIFSEEDCLNRVEFSAQAISNLTIAPTEIKGEIILNPPYGKRISGSKDLRNLYSQLGNVIRKTAVGWHLNYLAADDFLGGQIRIPTIKVLQMKTGSINISLQRGIVSGHTEEVDKSV